MKLEIFWLIEAHFQVRSSATGLKIAEKQPKKINFWSDCPHRKKSKISEYLNMAEKMNQHYSFLKLATLVLLLAGSNWLHAQCSVALTASIDPQAPAACNSTNGVLTIDMTGAAPYTLSLQFNGTPQPVMTSSQNQMVLTGLVTGTYQVTVTDNTGCTTSSGTVVTATPPLDMNLAPVATSCNQNNGSIACFVIGGQPPYTYHWSNGSTTQTITGLGAGTYSVTILDSYGCSFAGNALVQTSGGPNIGFAITNVSCFGLANGNINMTVTGGTPPYNYSWNNGVNTEDLNNLAAGIYTVTVTGANGCTATKTATISQPAIINLSLSTTSPCGNNAGGSINLSLSGGTPPYAYFWSNGATTQDLSSLTAGTYTVTVVDNVGCTKTGTAVLTAIPSTVSLTLSASVSTQLPEVCTGANGVLTMSATGNPPFDFKYQKLTIAFPPYPIFSVNSSQNTVSIPNLGPGNYGVTVTDNSGICSATQTITIIPTPVLGVTLTPTNSACTQNNGTVTSSVSGGSAPFTYNWTNGDIYSTLINLAAGQYGLTVADANGCTALASTTVSSAIPVSISGANNICPGTAVTLTASGTGTYAWSNGATTPSIEVVLSAPGTYTVTLTDSNGCTGTASKIVGIISPPTVAISGAGNGTACLGTPMTLVASGQGGVTYFWSTGVVGSANNFINAIPGPNTYTVTVFNSASCTNTASVTVNVLPTTNAAITGNGIICTGESTVLTASGGGNFLWSTGETTATITVAPANIATYVVTVSDPNTCSSSAFKTVQRVVSLSAQVVNNDCSEGSSGTININVNGGGPATDYTWNTAANTPGLTNVPAGTYTVTVTGAGGCTSSATATVGDAVSVSVNSVTNSGCSSAVTGSIDILVTGGQPGYTYTWSDGATTQDLVNHNPNTYTVTVTDQTGCTTTTSATILSVPPIIVIENIIPINCTTGGGINLTVTGGTLPYTFSWSGPNGFTANTKNIGGLFTGGIYVVFVTDANGCTFQSSFTLLGQTPITTNTVVTNATCGASDGNINLSVTSGSNSFSYLWSNGSTQQDINNLAAGTYMVTITDNGTGCTTTAQAIVQNTTIIQATPQITNEQCFGMATGAINLTVAGASPPFNFAWSNGAISSDISGLSAGTYTVTISDNGGCFKIFTYTVTEPQPLQASFSAINPNCNGGTDGLLAVFAQGGTFPVTYNWEHIPGNNDPQTINNLAAGTYTVTITDNNGCSASNSITLVQPQPIAAYVALNQLCGSTTMTITSTTGGNPPFVYQWSNGVTGTVNVANISGLYSVTITDANGCTFTQTIYAEVVTQGGCSYFGGKVVIDANTNCINDTETGLASWIVRATGSQTYYGISDAAGNYHIGVDPGETYLIEAIPPGSLWMPCTGLTVTAPLTPDTTSGLDLPVQEILQCPEMEVHLYSGNIRRCFNNNYYGVEYCNNGTAPAQDAYIIVSMDAFSLPLSSTLPFTNLGNNNYRFDIGDVAVGECNNFGIVFKVNCNAITGQTLCATAHIYPDSTCMPPNALWSGASLALSSACTGDSLRFTVKNVGFGNMTQTLDYIVVEDHVMLFANPIKLNAGQSKIVSVPSNGSTWRLSIPQEPYHPGHSNPSLTVEGCSTNSSSFSTGFVNQFPQDDVDPWIDILCVQLSAAFDPNEKVAFPTGYGNEHFVQPGTQLEYGIHFQNTGNDTAFTVRLVDTLSQWLDPATIRPGASSHPYTFDLTGTGIATFTFDNILLPDSNVNEVASHGFVQFSISPKTTTPLETVINNSAAIYFDYNPPIFTNTTYHTIGDHFLVVGLWQPENPAYEVVVSPNPSSGLTNITIKGLVHSDALQLQVLDAYGRVVVNQQSSGNSFLLDGATLPAGMYYFRVVQEGALVGNGKVIRK